MAYTKGTNILALSWKPKLVNYERKLRLRLLLSVQNDQYYTNAIKKIHRTAYQLKK